MNDTTTQLDKIKKLISISFVEQSITPEELESILLSTLKVIEDIYSNFDSSSSEMKGEYSSIQDKVRYELDDLKVSIENATSNLKTELGSDISSVKESLYAEIKRIYNLINGLPKPQNVDEQKLVDTAVNKALQAITPKIQNINVQEIIRQAVEQAKSEIKIEPADNSIFEKLERDIEELKKEIAETPKSFFGGSGSRPIRVYNNGTAVSENALELNFINAYSFSTDGKTGRRVNITVSNNGLSNILAATGVVDGDNVSFTFTQRPSYIVSDHATYRENVGWTWNSGTLTATMAVPPVDDIFGFA